MTEFLRAYLFAYIFYCGIALGSLSLVMILHITWSGWGQVIRRPLEAAARTLPLLLLLFVPIAAGTQQLYPWARAGAVAASEVLQHRRAYLNLPLFLVRAAIYFGLWIGLTYLLDRGSRQQDRSTDARIAARLRAISAPGLVVFGLSVTLAFIDWVMSLSEGWYSTIFGMLIIVGQCLSALAFLVLVLVTLARRPPLAGVLTPRHLHNVGKLLLAFVMLWAYLSFSQWLLTYAGNLPEEIRWYLPRLRGGWQIVGLLLIILHFALPFVLLLSRDLKRHGATLAAVAGLILVMRVVDELWLVAPEFHPGAFAVRWLDAVLLLGLGVVWLGYYRWQLGRAPLLTLGARS